MSGNLMSVVAVKQKNRKAVRFTSTAGKKGELHELGKIPGRKKKSTKILVNCQSCFSSVQFGIHQTNKKEHQIARY
jgi:hypothetical protein